MTISGILQNGCADPSVVDCYCGRGAGSACADAAAATGACVVAENGGLETSSPSVALSVFDSSSLAAGVANAIFACAQANRCATCLAAGSLPETDAAAANGDSVEAAPADVDSAEGAVDR